MINSNIMDFINRIRAKQQLSRQENINMQALIDIKLMDFDNKIFISFNDAPLVPIQDNWTPKQILSKLEETRNSYINYKMSQYPQTKNSNFAYNE